MSSIFKMKHCYILDFARVASIKGLKKVITGLARCSLVKSEREQYSLRSNCSNALIISNHLTKLYLIKLIIYQLYEVTI